ncbi:MAG: hypothetical protein QJR12_03880 [Mycobacterium sp.]|nr:hypothetical protein [Mycobacterium sp.]MDI3313442.1 hypothetical protein [Mycobacterium sp.]
MSKGIQESERPVEDSSPRRGWRYESCRLFWLGIGDRRGQG